MMNAGYVAFQGLAVVFVLGMAVYLPGRLLLRGLKIQLDPWEALAAALAAGAGQLALAYGLAARAEAASFFWLPVLLAALAEVLLWIRDSRRPAALRHNPDAPARETLPTHWPVWLLMAGAMLLQGYLLIGSGWPEAPAGLELLAWNAQDAPWHVFNLEQLARGFPPEVPGQAGVLLKDSPLFSGLLWGAVARLGRFDSWNLYFRVAPFFYSALLVLTLFVAGRAWAGRPRTGYWAAGLAVFTGNLSYLIPWLLGAKNYPVWDGLFGVFSPLFGMVNPGPTSAAILLLCGVWALIRWQQGGPVGFLFLLGLLWGVLPGFAVYPGWIVAGAFFVLAVVRAGQRDFRPAMALAAVVPVFVLTVWLSGGLPRSAMHLTPGSNLAGLLVSPDRLALLTQQQWNQFSAQAPFGVVLLLAGLVLVFIIGNLGVRIVGWVPMLRSLNAIRQADPILLLITFLTAGALAGAIFLAPRSVPGDLAPVFYFAVIVSALPAARQLESWTGHGPTVLHWVTWAGVVLFSAPGLVQVLWHAKPISQVPPETVAVFSWLRHHAEPGSVWLRPVAGLQLPSSAAVTRPAHAEALDQALSVALNPTPEAARPDRKAELEQALAQDQVKLEKINQQIEEARLKAGELAQSLAHAQAEAAARAAAAAAITPEPDPIVGPEAAAALSLAPEAQGSDSSSMPETQGSAPALAPAVQANNPSAVSPPMEAAAAIEEADKIVRAWKRSLAKANQAVVDYQRQSQAINRSILNLKHALTELEKTGGSSNPVAERPAPAPTPSQPDSDPPNKLSVPSMPVVPGWPDSTIGAALSGHNSFAEGVEQALIQGFPVAGRVQAVRHFYQQADVVEARVFLEKNRIQYVIVPAGQALPFEPEGVPLQPVFRTASAVVYKFVPVKIW